MTKTIKNKMSDILRPAKYDVFDILATKSTRMPPRKLELNMFLGILADPLF